ncbi:MAG: hypothetical protein GWN85_14100, partial [Gemmatimonadetes bacterium]|nr:hypothetical protein [Gemmatimonadota bacterium]NIR36848.1 hypothetical protein [Actinomycetota bacterium]
MVYTLHVADHDDIVHASAANGWAPRPVIATPVNETSAVVSPDGRWIAYVSSETGEGEVYIRSFPEPGPP